MSKKEPLGLTLIPRPGATIVPVYQHDEGLETFETDAPYVTSEGHGLQAPIPVIDAGGPFGVDSLGNRIPAWAVKLVPDGGVSSTGALNRDGEPLNSDGDNVMRTPE